jgi:hypothetical protein
MSEEVYFEDNWAKRMDAVGNGDNNSIESQVSSLLDAVVSHVENASNTLDQANESALHSRRSTLMALVILQRVSMVKVSPHTDVSNKSFEVSCDYEFEY